LPADAAVRIRAKIVACAADPAAQAANVKRLKGTPAFRLRVGDYRVIFELGKDRIDVLDVGHRKDIYG